MKSHGHLNKALSHWHNNSKSSTLGDNTRRHLESQIPQRLFPQTKKFRSKQVDKKELHYFFMQNSKIGICFLKVKHDMNGNLEIKYSINMTL